MNYRGRDLDLRTPDRMPPGAIEATTADERPVLVDEAVLACCNHGYDLALAHRAREVRIEHLLNAMTRTDAAASVLAAHGIDVAGLRQDTAGLIAADDNIVPGNERVSPRRSQPVADLLHIASERARARHSTVLVADLLRTLFEFNSDQQGVVMLKRNAPGWQPRNPAEPLRSEPLPPLFGTYAPEQRYVGEPGREWGRMPQQPAGYYAGGQPGYYVPAESSQQGYQVPEPQPATAPATVTDQVQNTRLDQLERTIRELSGELLAERKLAQAAVEYRREAPPTMPGGLDMRARAPGEERHVELELSAMIGERLSLVERNVESRFTELARGWSVLGERLQGIEQAVNAGRGESPGLEGVVATLASLTDRLQAMERHLTARSPVQNINLEPVIERLSAIERAQAARPSAAAVDFHPLFDRMAAMERSIGNRIGNADFAPVLERLQSIDGRVAEINRGAGGIADRITLVERRLESGGGTTERNLGHVVERVRVIEEALIAQRNQVAQLATSLTADVKALGQAVESSGATGEHVQSLIGERFEHLTASFETDREEIATAFAQTISERMGQMGRLIETQRTEIAQAMAETGGRLAGLEARIQDFGQRALDLHAAYGTDLVELHNALVKLNTNQQTLASSLDQWRLENGNELAQIGVRIDGVERTSSRPVALLESMQGSLQTLQRTTARREEQRSRFRHWLMGTDDWYGASWEHSGASTISPASQGGNGIRDQQARG